MRYILLFLILSCYAAEDTVSQAVAVKVSNIMKRQEDAVKIANETALKDLKKMLVSNKKDKNACILIAKKIIGLDKEDKESLEILKDVPVEMATLLGDKGDPGKYISEAKAKFISEALMKGKFTSTEWDSMPGEILICKTWRTPTSLNWKKGQRIFAVPHPTETFLGGDNKKYTWNSGSGVTCGCETLSTKEGEPVTVLPMGASVLLPYDTQKVDLLLFAGGAQWPNSKGSIRVKIYEVVPFE
jgi:hypothetical protein